MRVNGHKRVAVLETEHNADASGRICVLQISKFIAWTDSGARKPAHSSAVDNLLQVCGEEIFEIGSTSLRRPREVDNQRPMF